MVSQLSSSVVDGQNGLTLDKLHLEMQDAAMVDLVAHFARRNDVVHALQVQFSFMALEMYIDYSKRNNGQRTYRDILLGLKALETEPGDTYFPCQHHVLFPNCYMAHFSCLSANT